MAGAIGQLLIQLLLEVENFIGLNTDVAGLAPSSTQGLVDHDPRVGEAASLALGARSQQKGPHGGRQAHAHGLHIRLDVLHGVEDAKPVVHRAPRGIDVHEDVLVGVLRLEEEELGDHPVGGFSGYGLTEKNDPLAQQARIDIERPFAPTRLFNDDRDHGPNN